MKSRIYEIGDPKGKLHNFQKTIVQTWRKCRFLSLMVARQHGKSHLAREVLADFIFCFNRRRNPEAAVVLKTAQQGYAIYFAHLDRILEKLPGGIYTKQGTLGSSLRITIKRVWLKDPDYVTINIVGAGNPNALRGRTHDLVITDECGYWSSEVWFAILKSTVDATNGLALLTSTVNGRDQWFYKNHINYEEMAEEGFSSVAALEFNVYTAGLKSEDWIKTEEEMYKRSGRLNVWEQEYMNNPDAMTSADEAPFALAVNKFLDAFRKKKMIGQGILPFDRTVYVALDLGKRNNNPAWEFIMSEKEKVNIIGYTDDDASQYALIDRIFKKYKDHHKIVLIYPNDALQPSIVEGVPRLALFNKHIQKRGYQNKIKVRILEKTKNRVELVNAGVELVQSCWFDVKACLKGLEKLAGVRMKKENQSGFISPKDFARNDKQHSGDAICHVAAAVQHGFTNDYRARDYEMGQNSVPGVAGRRSLKYS